jgi:ubiquinone/menaquinone biosynthesis C-methylase UbiE
VIEKETDVAAASERNLEGWEPEWARRLYRWFALVYDPFRALWSVWTRGAEDDLDRLFGQHIDERSRILELAPGTGINLQRLFRCAPGFETYLGIDVSEAMLKRARRRSRATLG